jgi:DNA-binding LacI/PurR family transcriptional regulator
VLRAASRLGYRPDRAASLLARRRSRLIGVMMNVRNSFHAEMVEDVHEAAEQHGYDLVLSTITRTRDERRAIETLLDSRCEALVLLGPDAPAAYLAALDRQLPVVVIGRPIPSAGVDIVRAADDRGTAQATEHLIELGHRDIAYVDGGSGTIATRRRQGYQRAMRHHRLGGHIRILAGDHTEESGASAAGLLIASDPRPTAVLTYNDRSAVGLLDALRRAGIPVPDEISIIGYDDSPLSRLAHINLTTVSQNAHELTQHAIATLMQRLEGDRTEHREIILAPRLTIRGTTAAPPQRGERGDG